MLENYEKYLNLITNKIEGFFEKQKPYIFCKKGCAKCCEKGEYPWSEIEFKFIMKGFSLLDPSIQNEIKEKVVSEIKRIRTSCQVSLKIYSTHKEMHTDACCTSLST